VSCTRSSRNIQLWVALCLSAFGCTPQANALWIETGSTADHLVFGIAQTRGGDPVHQFGVLRVYECDGPQIGNGAMWVLFQERQGPAVRQVAYGETPPGYRSGQGPRPLVPGCYQAIATTGGMVEFTVTRDGRIVEAKPRIRWDRGSNGDAAQQDSPR
jgi:hypothetical protein